MKKVTKAFLQWCHDPSPEARFTRTIAQGVIGVLVSGVTTGEWGAAAIVGAIMALLSPIQAEIAKGQTDENGISPYNIGGLKDDDDKEE